MLICHLEEDKPEINFQTVLRCFEHYSLSFFFFFPLSKKQMHCSSHGTLEEKDHLNVRNLALRIHLIC